MRVDKRQFTWEFSQLNFVYVFLEMGVASYQSVERLDSKKP